MKVFIVVTVATILFASAFAADESIDCSDAGQVACLEERAIFLVTDVRIVNNLNKCTSDAKVDSYKEDIACIKKVTDDAGTDLKPIEDCTDMTCKCPYLNQVIKAGRTTQEKLAKLQKKVEGSDEFKKCVADAVADAHKRIDYALDCPKKQ